jgi:hypothetical protein
VMVVALPLIDSVAGVELEGPADELGCVGEAPVPDDVPDVPDDELEPDEVLDVPVDVLVDVLAPDELLAVPDAALGALVSTPTPAGEHPKSVTDKTNTTMVALAVLMDSSWSSASRMSLDGDSSIMTKRRGISTSA